MNNILSCKQFTRESLEELLDLAQDIKANPNKYSKVLEDKIIAPIFFEPSTRTRLSFETAALRLGARLIATENAQNSSTKKGESLKDTIRIIAGYADCIVMRHNEDDAAEVAASVSKVPILNAGSGKKEHPSQSLLDIFTIREKRGKIDGVKVAILGDLVYGRTIHSLLELLCLYEGVEVWGLSKDAFKLPQRYKEMLENHNIKYHECRSFDELPRDIDVLYHTRIQSERFEGDFGREEFIIDKSVLSKFLQNTLVMHPLPRLEEISEDIDDDPRAVFFEQAHNGVPIRMAMYLTVFGRTNI